MWKWLNPWRELRQAREQIALLEAECDALDREARDARRVAYAEAHEHYEMRTKALQASHDQLLQRCVDIQNMMTRPAFISPPDLPATPSGTLSLNENRQTTGR